MIPRKGHPNTDGQQMFLICRNLDIHRTRCFKFSPSPNPFDQCNYANRNASKLHPSTVPHAWLTANQFNILKHRTQKHRFCLPLIIPPRANFISISPLKISLPLSLSLECTITAKAISNSPTFNICSALHQSIPYCFARFENRTSSSW